jgi:hypothetical protein
LLAHLTAHSSAERVLPKSLCLDLHWCFDFTSTAFTPLLLVVVDAVADFDGEAFTGFDGEICFDEEATGVAAKQLDDGT